MLSNNNNNEKNPHLNFLKGTILGDKEQAVGPKWILTILFQTDIYEMHFSCLTLFSTKFLHVILHIITTLKPCVAGIK